MCYYYISSNSLWYFQFLANDYEQQKFARKIAPTVPIIAMLFNTGALLILFNSKSVFVNAKFKEYSPQVANKGRL